MTSEVGGNREHVAEIHRQRITGFVTKLKCHRGRSWCENRITLGVSLGEVVSNQATHFQGFAVIGVVIAGRQCIGAEHDASLYFVAKTCCSRGSVHRIQIFGIHAQAVAHAIETCEIAARFGRSNQVVRSQAVQHRRHLHIHHRCTSCAQRVERSLKLGKHVGRRTLGHVSDATDAHALHTFAQLTRQHGRRLWQRC